ncbi:succinylglutamate desuccinylase/aspartoacylase family protein [Crocosphaera sp. UHCC 0190]|uniref:succinylglutamate desuccinylase/aspartoacylase family protein n=1 Tax=Crocosphaera sp. UHCC 0190 TaxID=3110246 RepID=UPI002B218101|nr:succinylglutamate desuccinylase/aspartoacylase family protein [Crocosphaera sp. UHCC 0190]MEA5508794.1 succinylglutamate desuccinylase/aspartoacylase family protein [Crocosphaera sp. UHCC 0190]
MKPKIQTFDLLKLASGDQLSLQVYQFIGKKSDKKVYIQSNLHGSEIVGNAVIAQLIDFFSGLKPEQLDGEVWLVPICNPIGTNQRNHFFATGRYNSYDGKDWNRIFWDYEKNCQDLEGFVKAHFKLDSLSIQESFLKQQKKAFTKQLDKIQGSSSAPLYEQYRYQLQSLSIDANYVIDLHSSSNQGIDYLFCFPGKQEESAKYFNIDYGISMNTYDGDAFDESFMKPWLALEKKFKELGRDINVDRESWTLELGSGMQMNPQSVAVGVSGIKNYLVKKNVLKLPNYSPQITEIKLVSRQQIKSYYAPTGGMVQNRMSLKHTVKAGDKLYQIISFNKQGKLPEIIDIYAENDGFIFDVSTSYSVNQGEYILALLSLE